LPIRSALLTSGSGAVVNSTYKALKQYTDLCGIVFSKYEDPEPRWKKFKIYGFWYMLQYFLTKIINILTRNSNIKRLLSPNIVVKIWKSRKERKEIFNWLQNLNIDLILVSDIHYILPSDFFSKFRYCINIHPSPLPKYRGPNPIIWGLLDKSSEFGISLHLIDEGIDTGDIICQKTIRKPILPLYFVIEMKLAKLLPELIKHSVEEIQGGKLHARKQEEGFYLSFPTLANRKLRKQNINILPP